ncbi:MAG: primosomal protein N' [Rothia sp. (in: high G+C Gram-positive bacteria)]|uniref:primosomal protein N' family DNA-binding protein n=1 Tax=Rothia sp. (in: high G+C Gram-positive bacteria) TaxID=1885016 RepID=UPI0026DF518B|nr:primosomal protein N' [Rothia sp. (in: high G+C Gram-positive bacteria)]MDO5750701.1 primosomal protein N' [Rothia sp. (in: high G+C Gram-positive bacteria)]
MTQVSSNPPEHIQQESLQQPDLLQGFPALEATLTQPPLASSHAHTGVDGADVPDPNALLAATGVPNPVARICVDTTVPHLDRPFDYAVPPELSEQAVIGARVRVAFGPQRVTGYILERVERTDYAKPLAPILSVLSAFPAVAPETFELAEDVAARFASTRANVLRLALTPRIAGVEKKYAAAFPSYSEYCGLTRENTNSDLENESTKNVVEKTNQAESGAENDPENQSLVSSGSHSESLGESGSTARTESSLAGSEATSLAIGDTTEGSAEHTLGTGAATEPATETSETASETEPALNCTDEAIRSYLLGGFAPFTLNPAVAVPDTSAYTPYINGSEFLEDIAAGHAARAVMSVLPSTPDTSWADLLAIALAQAAAHGRGAIAVVPDSKSLDTLEEALRERVSENDYTRISSDQKPYSRYHGYLKARLGLVPIVIGTRAAAYAPVANLGFIACWDDGDSNLIERRAPYCHVRDVLLLRAQKAKAAALFAGYFMSIETARLVNTGWASYVHADRATVRAFTPQVLSTGDDYQLARDPLARIARIPQLAFIQARKALAAGPVLVQVARGGYLPTLRCQRCFMPARCTECRGPLEIVAGSSLPSCTWCGHLASTWSCAECGNRTWRAGTIGATRTAEELGRAFPNVPVISSSGDHVRAHIGSEPALVIATPGAEPRVPGGYAAALLLDADSMLRFDSLRAPEAALRRWMNAAALVRSASVGGVVVTTASYSPVEQALVRWDPGWFARYELEERFEVGLPPAVRSAAITGAREDVQAFIDACSLPETVRISGPIPVSAHGLNELDYEEDPQVVAGDWRVLLFFGYPVAAQVTAELRAVRAAHSAMRSRGHVQVLCDGLDII